MHTRAPGELTFRRSPGSAPPRGAPTPASIAVPTLRLLPVRRRAALSSTLAHLSNLSFRPQRLGAARAGATRAFPRGLMVLASAGSIAGSALIPARALAQPGLATLPLQDPAYVQLAALDRMGCRLARVSAYRPYFVDDLRHALARAVNDSSCRAGGIAAALAARFGVSGGVPAPAAPPPPDTTVAPDLAAAAASSTAAEAAQPPTRTHIGAAVTARLAALNGGEFRPLYQDIRPVAEGDPGAVIIGRVRGSAELTPKLAAVAEFYAQTSRQNDPLIRQKALSRTSGAVDFSEAYVNGRAGPVAISFGRAREAWLGDGDESLVVSANGPPLDRLLAAALWRRFEIRAFFAVVDDVVLTAATDSLTPGTPNQLVNRALVGHSISIRPHRSVELTFGETLLHTRAGSVYDLSYANPLMSTLITQNDSSRTPTTAQDNLVVFAGGRYRVGGAVVRGELVVDEFQKDAPDRKSNPDQLAWLLGVSVPVPISRPATISATYRHVNAYTYLRSLYSTVYQQYNRPLGSELGPDAEALAAEADLWPSAAVRLSVGGALWRRGALRIDQRPAQGANGHAGEPFPSVSTARPLVQRALLGNAQIEWLTPALPIVLRVESASVDNVNNQPTAPQQYLRATLQATYAFRYP